MTRPVGRSNQASRLSCRRTSTRYTVEGGISRRTAIRTGPSLRERRSASIRRSIPADVRRGLRRGRELRSANPVGPSSTKRSHHLYAVAREMPISAAT
jgi:hypothetical protein